MMNKTILTIGYTILGNHQNHLRFNSRGALDDAEIVLLEPRIPRDEYYPNHREGDKILFDLDASQEIVKGQNHWNSQLSSFLEKGGTVFSFLVKKEECILELYYHSKVTPESITFNNYALFNVDFFESLECSNGNCVEFTGHKIFSEFYEKFKEYLCFEAYLEPIPKNVSTIFTTRYKNRAVGVFFKYGGGHVVFLPCLKELGAWDEECNQFFEDEKLGQEFMWCLMDIDKSLKGEKTEAPKWLVGAEFSTKKARSLERTIKMNEGEVEKIQSKNEELQEELDEENIIKGLLFETGKPLENAVTQALEILGYKVKPYNDGTLEIDQMIESPDGQRFIGECEGKDSKKDVGVTKLSQLLKNIALDLEREEGTACGILFGNAQRKEEPAKRSAGFTQNCEQSAKTKRIALVRTMDLFAVVKYLQDNDDEEFKKKCRDAIYERCDENGDGGGIVEFPSPPSSSSP